VNVLFLVEGAQIGGAEADVLRLATELAARGHRAVLGSFGAPLRGEAERSGFATVRLPGGVRLLAGVSAIARACRAHAIDLVNAHTLHTTALAGAARRLRLCKAPVVATVHDLQRRPNDRLAASVLRHLPDQVIFVSRHERERLAESSGKPAIGHVIYSGIERPRPGMIDPLDLRALHGIPADARVIGFVGRLAPEKAVGDVIAALPRLPDDVVLCVVGEGPEEGALRAETRRRKLEKRVVFAGFSGEVPRYLSSFVLLVLPSRRESLPAVLCEAGMIGLPVVAADVGGVREVVVPRETGLLYESGDVDALVRAIRVVLDDPSRAASMGVAGRERIAQLFDVKSWVDETEALFARIARAEGK
jgi:glycosyltransferase involved in cell wall biosynthesis